MMKIIEYENLILSGNSNKESDGFVLEIISLMPNYVKDSSEVVTRNSGALLYEKDEPITHIYITVDGEISIVNEFESGKIFEPVILHHSDFTGVVEAILGMDEIISTNIAKTDVTYIKVPKQIFLKWLDDSHKITRYVLNSVSTNFKKNMAESGESVILDSMYLLVSYLLRNTNHDNLTNFYVLHETRERTSIRTGINIRTLYRHIKKLRQDGLITMQNRNIAFSDTQKMHLYDYYLQLRNK